MAIGRIKPVQSDYPTISWANGLVKAREVGGTRFGEFVGFFTERGQDPDIDAAFTKAGAVAIEVQHSSKGKGVIKTYWSLGEIAKFYPLTKGAPAPTSRGCLSTRNQQRTAEAGIGLRWQQDFDNPDKQYTLCDIIVYPDILVQVGYFEPFKLHSKSLMVDYFIKSLSEHYSVATFADSIVDREKHPDPVDLHEVAWVIGAGAQISFGRQEATLVTPVVSHHPKEVSKEYVRSIYLRDNELGGQFRKKVEQDWEGVLSWAKEFSKGVSEVEETPLETTIEGSVVSVDQSSAHIKLTLVDKEGNLMPCVAFQNLRNQIMGEGIVEGNTMRIVGKLNNNSTYGKQIIIQAYDVFQNTSPDHYDNISEEDPF